MSPYWWDSTRSEKAGIEHKGLVGAEVSDTLQIRHQPAEPTLVSTWILSLYIEQELTEQGVHLQIGV